MSATPPEVRKARAFLQGRKISSKEVPPRPFANAAKELDVGFSELLRLIARLQSGGQGQSTFRLEAIREAAANE